jgi:hypothetical protein
VVERLGHPVHAAVTVDEAVVGDAVAVLQPVRERGPEIPRDRPEVAELGVGSVTVRADALIPVLRGRRGRIARHGAGERVEPWRLVEVAVDDQGGTRHGSVVSTVFVMICDQCSPGRSVTGQDSNKPLP